MTPANNATALDAAMSPYSEILDVCRRASEWIRSATDRTL